MSARQSFKSLAFRIHMKPAPRTQSESNAILSALLDFGPVNVFQIDRRPAYSAPPTRQDDAHSSAVANLVFTKSNKSVEFLKRQRDGHEFTVTANANIPDPKVQDPYNVRGLQDRKPALAPREIECRILSIEHENSAEQRAVLNGLNNNEYTDGFNVNRASVLGEILAKTDCPSGLIHGLLPWQRDRRRNLQDHADTFKSDGEGTSMLEGDEGQELEADDLDARAETEDLPANRGAKPAGKKYDRYAAIRDFSLMGLYREATRGNRVEAGSKDAPRTGSFSPFNDRS